MNWISTKDKYPDPYEPIMFSKYGWPVTGYYHGEIHIEEDPGKRWGAFHSMHGFQVVHPEYPPLFTDDAEYWCYVDMPPTA